MRSTKVIVAAVSLLSVLFMGRVLAVMVDSHIKGFTPTLAITSAAPLYVTGYVYGADNLGISGVEVIVLYPNQGLASGYTNKDGYYYFPFTKTDKITIQYRLYGRETFVPDLEDISGNKPHTISRIETDCTRGCSVSQALELNSSAQRAAGIADSTQEEREAAKAYYGKLLGGLRVKQETVGDAATLLFLKSKQDETRRMYGLTPETLMNENNQTLTVKPRPTPTGTPFLNVQPSSCMTVEVLRELLTRICTGRSSSISGLSNEQAQALALRQKLCVASPLQNDRPERDQPQNTNRPPSIINRPPPNNDGRPTGP